MSDSLLRLRVDNQEYDNKLKRATQGLQNYVDGCRKAAGTLAVVEDETLAFVRALGDMDTVASTGTQKIREMIRSITDLTLQYRSLTDEEKQSPFGQAMAESIQRLTERAGQARDAMEDVNLAIQHAASDTRVFDQIAGTVSITTASFQTLQGAAKLMGVDLGDNVEVIAKLQAAMAVTNGLTQIQNGLQKQSAVMQGVVIIQTKALAAAQALNTKATGSATVAQAAFNAVANANPYVLLATAVATVTTALVLFARHSRQAAEAEKIQAEETDKLRQKHQAMQEAIGAQVGNIEAKYRMLQHEWNRLQSDGEKVQFINDQAKAFQELGLKIDSVTEAEQALVDKAPQVLAALKAVATAEAYSDLYKQAIQKRATEWDNRIQGVDTGDTYTPVSEREMRTFGTFLPDEWKAAGLVDTQDYIQQFDGLATTQYQLTKEGVDKINAYREQQAKALNQKLQQQYDDEVNFYEQKWTDAENNVLAARSKLPLNLLTSPTTTDTVIQENPIAGSLPDLTRKLKELKDAQSQALDNREWAIYQQQIEHVQYQIDALKGSWKEGLHATFTLTTNDAEVLSQIEQIQGVQLQDKTISVTADDADAQEQLDQLDGKTITVTADTAMAYNQVLALTKDIDNTTVSFSITPEIDRAVGQSITTQAGLNNLISSIRQQIQDADFGSDIYQSLTEKLADATMLQNLVKESLSVGLGTALFDVADETGQDFWDRVLSPEGVENADWQGIADVINQKRKELGLDAITLDFNSGKVGTDKKGGINSDTDAEIKAMQQLAGGLSQVSSGLSQIGIEVPEGVTIMVNTMQGLVSIINGAQTIMSLLQGTAIPANIAAINANTMATYTLASAQAYGSAVDTAETFAKVVEAGAMIAMMKNGGIVKAAYGYAVPGTHYSGDTTPILANAGELILNRAQQGNLASQLEDTKPESPSSARPYVTGEDIFLGLSNYLKAAGLGEIVTTR